MIRPRLVDGQHPPVQGIMKTADCGLIPGLKVFTVSV